MESDSANALRACLQRLADAEELLSSTCRAEEIIAGVRETLLDLCDRCGPSKSKLANTHQVPPDFSGEVFSQPAPPTLPMPPPLCQHKDQKERPQPMKAQVLMDQVVLEALREDNKRKVNARIAEVTSARANDAANSASAPSKTVSTTSVFSFSCEPSRPECASSETEWGWVWTPICSEGRIHLPIINPDSQIRLAWDIVGLIFICYETYALPVYLAFDFQFVGVFFAIAAVLDAYFILDIFMSYLTAIRTPSGSLISAPKDIARAYSRRWLFLDVLAGIPWELVNSMVPWNIRSAQLFKMLRLVRVMRLIRFLRVDIFNESVKMYIETRPTLTFASGILRLLFILCAVTHWAACAWFCIGSRKNIGQTWVTKHLPSEFSVSEGYVYSLYFTLTTMTTVGYGDITPANLGEICFALLLLLIATVVFATVMGYLTDMIANVNSERNQQAEKILMLSNYMTWRNIPPHLYKAIRRHLLHLWETNKGYDSYEDQLQFQLTPVLRRELRFHIFGRVLRNAPFLAFLRDFEVCLKQLATKVSIRMLSRGDNVVRIGEANDQIFILVQGKVRLSLNESLWTNPASEELMDEIWSTYAPKKRRAHDSSTAFFLEGLHTAMMHQKRQKALEAAVNQSSYASAFQNVDATHTLFATKTFIRAEEQLLVQDCRQRRAARFIQTRWRQKLKARRARLTSQPIVCSMSIEAPAYFGESCLWDAVEKWDDEPPQCMYSVRCEMRSEVMCLLRADIGALIKEFSPWMGERFEVFREEVVQNLAEAAKVRMRQSPSASKLSELDQDLTSASTASSSKDEPADERSSQEQGSFAGLSSWTRLRKETSNQSLSTLSSDRVQCDGELPATLLFSRQRQQGSSFLRQPLLHDLV
ncbi:Kcnh5 [Symbiodinium natans]|uniref:Kcnh5 protein n=1 Tax=Symbiodinium natans TaxID=878477 RepID=A0A812KE50_9DINO|nr:Kcnh5 [Symbiodinium natans]